MKLENTKCALFFCIFWNVVFNVVVSNAQVDKDEIKQFNELLKTEKYFAVLFTKKCCDCLECVEAEALLGAIHLQVLEQANTVIGRLTNQDKVAKEYGVKDYPTLVFIRERMPIIYDGKIETEEVIDWLIRSRDLAIQKLNDDSFEHLTQASTGATTGDWLVSFYDSSCAIPNTTMFAILDTIALKSKGKKNIAIVNTEESKGLKERFKIQSCPTIYYFRLGKMFKYDLPTFTISSLTSFMDGFYKNSKGTVVPKIISPFDKLVETTAVYIKENKELSAAVGIFVIALAILSLWLSSGTRKEKSQ